MRDFFKLLIILILTFGVCLFLPKTLFTVIGFVLVYIVFAIAFYVLIQALAYKFKWGWWLNGKENVNE